MVMTEHIQQACAPMGMYVQLTGFMECFILTSKGYVSFPD